MRASSTPLFRNALTDNEVVADLWERYMALLDEGMPDG